VRRGSRERRGKERGRENEKTSGGRAKDHLEDKKTKVEQEEPSAIYLETRIEHKKEGEPGRERKPTAIIRKTRPQMRKKAFQD